MNLGFEYIKYRWKAKGRRTNRSPFIQDFTGNCLNINKDSEDYLIINSLINTLNKDKKQIEIEDFGAGSKKLGNQRSINLILKTSSSKGKYGDFLYRICKHYQFENILEFGTSLGIGSIHMQLGSKTSKITTVEACENTRELALSNFKGIEANLITSIHSTFDIFLKDSATNVFDMIFVDGHHDGDALLRYMKSLEAYSDDNTIFILDDIRWSDSMLLAWNTLKESDEFHIIIDLFRFVMLIIKSSHTKEEHYIRLYTLECSCK